MRGCINWKWHQVSYSLVESWIGASTINYWQIPVLQIVLDVSKFVMQSYQMVVRDFDALFDSRNSYTVINSENSTDNNNINRRTKYLTKIFKLQ
jgi:hypothetical protein